MFQPTTLLHPTDFSESARGAFEYALHLAKRRDATLHLLHVVTSLGADPVRGAFESGIDDEAFYERLAEEASQKMDALVDEARAAGVEVVPVLRRDPHADDAICDYAGDEGVDLVVMGTHGRRAISRLMLGSVAESVVQQAPCSVLTVREGRGDDGEGYAPEHVERILTPLDLSEYSVPLLRASNEVASTFQASIDVLHVIEPLPLPVPLIGGFTLNDLINEPTERAEEHLASFVERAGGLPVEVRTHVEEGHAASTILNATGELDVDLICIASHGLTGMARMFVGSVTARVVRRAPCPVLTLRVEPEEMVED
jgi:nucleotide-binding universal stress UspA family protein